MVNLRCRLVLTRTLVAGLAFVAALAIGVPANAQSIYVASAQFENANQAIVIRGGPFAAGLRVFFGVTEMSVTSLALTEVHTTAPASVPPGSYSLVVFQPLTGQIGLISLTRAPPRWEVVDAEGKAIGAAAGVGGNGRIIVFVAAPGGQSASISVGPQDWYGMAGDVAVTQAYFASSDCSGQAYIGPYPGGGVVGGIGGGYYLPSQGLNDRTLWVQSGPAQMFTYASTRYGANCIVGSHFLNAVPAVPTTVMSSFTAPFTIRLVP